VSGLCVSLRLRLPGFGLAVGFEAPAGITALFGPSGAGKSVTLRCVAGLLRPDAGRIALGERVLFDADAGVDLPARHRRVGLVFQQYALFPHLDVAANVAFGLRDADRARRAERVRELLALVHLEGYERRYPRELSGGQQQRVALARALAPGPELLLLDEPFAALDARVRRRLRGELRALHEATDVPMLLVTHDLAEVRHLADRLVLLDAGQVLRVGPTPEVLAEPGSEVAAELLR
jgi:molybdate transport system ATP-binding protein